MAFGILVRLDFEGVNLNNYRFSFIPKFSIYFIFRQENNRNKSKELHQKVVQHNHHLRASAKEVIGHASREVYACSPDNYVFGKLRLFNQYSSNMFGINF